MILFLMNFDEFDEFGEIDVGRNCDEKKCF